MRGLHKLTSNTKEDLLYEKAFDHFPTDFLGSTQILGIALACYHLESRLIKPKE